MLLKEVSMETEIVVMHYFKHNVGDGPFHLFTISNGVEGRLIVAKQTPLGLTLIKEPIEKYVNIVQKNNQLKHIHFELYMSDITKKIQDFSQFSLLDEATKGIADLLIGSASMTINMSDMLNVIQTDGFAVIYTGYASGTSRAYQVLERIQQHYKPNTELKAVLLSLHHPERSELTLDEITMIVKGVEQTFGKHAEFRYSYRANSTIGENIGITVIAA